MSSFKAILTGVSPALSVLVAMMMVNLVFGILGVSIFGGRFYACNDPNFPPGIGTKDECIGTFVQIAPIVLSCSNELCSR